MSYTIRAGNESDISSLTSVFCRSVRGTAFGEYSPAQVDAWAGRGTMERFGELFASGLQFWLAENESGVIGYAAVASNGYLHSLFVLPEWQRKGVATGLLKRSVGFAAEAGAGRLGSEVSLTAEPFFLHAGFVREREQNVLVDGLYLKNLVMGLEIKIPGSG